MMCHAAFVWIRNLQLPTANGWGHSVFVIRATRCFCQTVRLGFGAFAVGFHALKFSIAFRNPLMMLRIVLQSLFFRDQATGISLHPVFFASVAPRHDSARFVVVLFNARTANLAHMVGRRLIRSFLIRLLGMTRVVIVEMMRHLAFVRGGNFHFVPKPVVNAMLARRMSTRQDVIRSLCGRRAWRLARRRWVSAWMLVNGHFDCPELRLWLMVSF
jgi:hypothetical protein